MYAISQWEAGMHKHVRHLTRWNALLLLVSSATVATAQPTEAEAPAKPSDDAAESTTAPVDVVLLKDGGMVRGTIAEMVAGEEVTIVTLTGKTRTFSMRDVDYAGPVSKMPSPEAKAEPKVADRDDPKPAPEVTKQPLVTVHGEEARLSLVSKDAVTFHRRSASAVGTGGVAVGYDVMCTAPCEVSVPSGTYRLGLSKHGGAAIEADEDVVVFAGPSTVEGNYVDRSGLRRTGWIVFGVSAAVTALAPFVLTEEDCTDYSGCTDVTSSTGWTVAGVGVVGMLASIPLIGVSDKASISVSPGAPSGSGPAGRKEDGVATELGRLKGMTMTGAF